MDKHNRTRFTTTTAAGGLFIVALFLSCGFLPGAHSCSGSGCGSLLNMFTDALRAFSNENIHFYNLSINGLKLELTVNYACPDTCNICSYQCPLLDIWGYMENYAYPGYSTQQEPFPESIYGICALNICSPLPGCNGRRSESEDSSTTTLQQDSAPPIITTTTTETTTETTAKTATKTEETWSSVQPRGLPEVGTCSAGDTADCPSGDANVQCCNHSMGGQTFLCALDCGGDDAFYDCMNGVFQNYCLCLGVCQ